VASLLTPAPSADVQRFVEELGHPVTEKEETQLAGGLEADCG
jgi:hypothetical protein